MTTTDAMNTRQNGLLRTLSFLIVGLYAWVVTVAFGAVLLDVMYGKLVSEATVAFSEVADFLLLIGAVAVLAGIGAVVSSWRSKLVRSLLITSLLIIILKVFVPVLLFQDAQAVQALGAGTWIRLITSLLVSGLAFIGLYLFCRHE